MSELVICEVVRDLAQGSSWAFHDHGLRQAVMEVPAVQVLAACEEIARDEVRTLRLVVHTQHTGLGTVSQGVVDGGVVEEAVVHQQAQQPSLGPSEGVVSSRLSVAVAPVVEQVAASDRDEAGRACATRRAVDVDRRFEASQVAAAVQEMQTNVTALATVVEMVVEEASETTTMTTE